MRFWPRSVLFALFSYSSLFLTPGRTEDVLLLPQDQLANFQVENFCSKESPGGNCFGADVIFRMLSNGQVQFTAGPSDEAEKVKEKLIEAYTKNQPVVISGFGSSKEFLDYMANKENFRLPIPQEIETDCGNVLRFYRDNPLTEAVKALQEMRTRPRRGRVLHRFEQVSLFGEKVQESEDDKKQNEAAFLKKMIDQKNPIKLGLSAPGMGHAISVVGYQEPDNGQVPTIFYCVDSNHPRKFIKLKMEQRKKSLTMKALFEEKAQEAGLVWVYESNLVTIDTAQQETVLDSILIGPITEEEQQFNEKNFTRSDQTELHPSLKER